MERKKERKEKHLQNNLLRTIYKTMASKWFWLENKTKEREEKKKGSNIFGCGAFFSFCPIVYKNKKRERKWKTKFVFTEHIFTLRHFCWGKKDSWSDTTPLLHHQINRFTMLHYSAILSLRYLQWMNKYSYSCGLNHTIKFTLRHILKDKFMFFFFLTALCSMVINH